MTIAVFGHCFLELGDGANAERFARRSLKMVDGYDRGRAFNTSLLAIAHVQQGNVEEACAFGQQALSSGVDPPINASHPPRQRSTNVP